MSDFSMLGDIPDMYRHCKATEDKDMTTVDFITDHLINIDCLFDKHDHGDRQKPHQPVQNHHQGQTTVSFLTYFSYSVIQFDPVEVKPVIPTDNSLSSDYISKIFRPPII